MVDGIIAAHRATYRYIHAVQPGAQVPSNMAFFRCQVQAWLESLFPQSMLDSLDFIGVDHYYLPSVTDASVANAATGQMWKASCSKAGEVLRNTCFGIWHSGTPASRSG